MSAPENTNTLLQQLMGTMQSFMEENKKEKSELVSTLNSLQTSLLTTITAQRDALSDEHSPSSSEDDDEPSIDKDLATILNGSMTKPLHDEKLKSLMDQHPLPNNCESLAALKVNPEVWAKMTPPTRSKDIKLKRVERFCLKL